MMIASAPRSVGAQAAANLGIAIRLRQRRKKLRYSPKCRSKIVTYQFPNFTINNEQLSSVNEFKYWGHTLNNSQLDDADIYRERRNLFFRFYSCSVAVKLRLFKRFCLCFYDAALRNNFTAGSLDKLRSADVKCIKVFLDMLNIIVLPLC